MKRDKSIHHVRQQIVGIFGSGGVSFPCEETGDCPYEYYNDPEREIEGMPFVDGDPRSCPEFGHICAKFMEDFELTIEDLHIRGVIHCATVYLHGLETGKDKTVNEAFAAMLQEYFQIRKKYPPEKYPKYYTLEASPEYPSEDEEVE